MLKELLLAGIIGSQAIIIGVSAPQTDEATGDIPKEDTICYKIQDSNQKMCYKVEIPKESVEPVPTPAQPASEDIYQYTERRSNEVFGDGYYPDLHELVKRESGWRYNAQNPTSTAYGLFQFLNSTWVGTGIGKTDDPKQQIEAGLIYIKNRYQNPSEALRFHKANNWY